MRLVGLAVALLWVSIAPLGTATHGDDACAGGLDAGNAPDAAVPLNAPVLCVGKLAPQDQDDWYSVAIPFGTTRSTLHLTLCSLDAEEKGIEARIYISGAFFAWEDAWGHCVRWDHTVSFSDVLVDAADAGSPTILLGANWEIGIVWDPNGYNSKPSKPYNYSLSIKHKIESPSVRVGDSIDIELAHNASANTLAVSGGGTAQSSLVAASVYEDATTTGQAPLEATEVCGSALGGVECDGQGGLLALSAFGNSAGSVALAPTGDGQGFVVVEGI